MRLELVDADGEAVTLHADDKDENPIVFLDDVEFEVGRPAGSSRERRSSSPSRSTRALCRSNRRPLRVATHDRR